jgi:hypothetical protein
MVVHTYMVTKISFRGLTKKRAYYPINISVQPFILSFKQLAMTDAMQHQTKFYLEIELRNV